MRSPAGPAARRCWPTSSGRACSWYRSALPGESVRARPRLCLAQAYGAAQGLQPEVLEALLDDAERAFAASGDEPYEDPAGRPASVLANVPAAIAFLRAVLARLRGDAALAAGHNQQALDHLGEDDWLLRSFVRWNQAMADWLDGRLGPAERDLAEVLAELRAADEAIRRAGGEPAEVLRAVEGGAGFFAGFLAMRVCYDLGQVQRAQGHLDAAQATYRHALGTPGKSSQPPHLGLAHVGLAQVLYERDELTAALDHATEGVILCRQLASTPSLAAGLAVMARIRQAHGDAAGALEAMGEARQVEPGPAGDCAAQPGAIASGAAAAGPGQRPRGRPVDNGCWSQLRRRARLRAGTGISGAGPGAARPPRSRPGTHAAAAAARRRGQPGPDRFDLPAGLGDIAAGIAAPLVAFRLTQGTGRRAALWFNTFGMTDLVVALTLGAFTGFLLNVTPSSAPITELPLALIPTATVPLLLALHITAVSALVKAPRTPLPTTAPLTATAK
jgi:tetratricopeptide (TPR) repeat protein